MKAREFISELRTKKVKEPKVGDETPHDWNPGWADLNWFKKNALEDGNRMAQRGYQLFIPRANINAQTAKDRRMKNLANPYAYDDQGELKPQYDRWEQGPKELSPTGQVAESNGMKVVKHEQVGNFHVVLFDTGMGYQVRIYNGSELYHTDMSKNSLEKGLASFNDNVAYTKKQLRIEEAAPMINPGARNMVPPGGNKPVAQLWTSTAIKQKDGTWTSDWGQWIANNHRDWLAPKGYLYKVNPGALVLEFNDYDAERLQQAFADLGRAEPMQDRHTTAKFPWQEVNKHFDAVRVVHPGRDFTYGWDVESTAWLNTEHLTLVGEVPISQTGEDDEDY